MLARRGGQLEKIFIRWQRGNLHGDSRDEDRAVNSVIAGIDGRELHNLYVDHMMKTLNIKRKAGAKRAAFNPNEPMPLWDDESLDDIQHIFDWMGQSNIPIFDQVADGTNGLIYLLRGDFGNASLSFGAMIPAAGSAATATRIAANQIKNQTKTQVKRQAKHQIKRRAIPSSKMNVQKRKVSRNWKAPSNRVRSIRKGNILYRLQGNIPDAIKWKKTWWTCCVPSQWSYYLL